jgi:hypothetical protein
MAIDAAVVEAIDPLAVFEAVLGTMGPRISQFFACFPASDIQLTTAAATVSFARSFISTRSVREEDASASPR